MRAVRGVSQDRPPVWIMRQAGRYLPEYQEIKRQHSFVEMCTTPEIAVEVSLQPYRRFGFDAVIVFYDILFVPEAMGAPLQFTEKGPVFLRPLREAREIEKLHSPDLEATDPQRGTGAVLESLKALRANVPSKDAVLGFAGAPFTLAAYLVEGNFQRSGERVRRMMNEEPDVLHALLERLTVATVDYLLLQVEAGADAVQLFDTWAGLLSVDDFRDFALPYQQRIFSAVRATGAPTILYVNGSPHLLASLAESGATGLSVDWRQPLADVRRLLGSGIVLQGNLDPLKLFSPPAKVREMTQSLLDSMAGDSRYVFNLGHGIHRETPVESVEALVATVQAWNKTANRSG